MIPVPFFQSQPQPQMAQPQPYAVPPTPYNNVPAGWQANPPAQSPVLAAQAAQTNQPRMRGYAPEAMPQPQSPRMLKLPAPEHLGLAVESPTVLPTSLPAAAPTPAAAEIDWNATHARLRQMGAVGFHLDHLPGNVTRVTVLMPSGQPGQSQPVEVIASTEAAAIATLLERLRNVGQ